MKKIILNLLTWWFYKHDDIHGLVYYDEEYDIGIKIKCERGLKDKE